MTEGSYNPSEGTLRLSKSSFMTYSKCPKLYWWSYIQELNPPASEAMIRGTEIHSVLESHLLESKPITTAAADLGIQDAVVDELNIIMEQLWEENPTWTLVEAEKKHEIPITIEHEGSSYQVILVGKIDGVFLDEKKNLIIVELKTGELTKSKVTRTKKELNFYRYMLECAGYNVEKCRYMVIAPDATDFAVVEQLAKKRSTQIVAMGEISGIAYIDNLHMGSYNNTLGKINTSVHGIYAEDWPANWNEWYCPEYCAYHLSCEAERYED